MERLSQELGSKRLLGFAHWSLDPVREHEPHVVPRLGKCLCQSCERHLPRSICQKITEAPIGAERVSSLGLGGSNIAVLRVTTDKAPKVPKTHAKNPDCFGGGL